MTQCPTPCPTPFKKNKFKKGDLNIDDFQINFRVRNLNYLVFIKSVKTKYSNRNWINIYIIKRGYYKRYKNIRTKKTL